MTEAARIRDMVHAWAHAQDIPVGTYLGGLIDLVDRSLTTARAEERAGIVAWLDAEAAMLARNDVYRYVIHLTSRIERGDYGRSTQADGWRLVPVEPTREMLAAAEADYARRGNTFWSDFACLYRAMLAATPPKEPADG